MSTNQNPALGAGLIALVAAAALSAYLLKLGLTAFDVEAAFLPLWALIGGLRVSFFTVVGK